MGEGIRSGKEGECSSANHGMKMGQKNVDYSEYDIDVKGPGVFELVFLIYSDNFPAIKESFILKIGTKKEGLSFYRA